MNDMKQLNSCGPIMSEFTVSKMEITHLDSEINQK